MTHFPINMPDLPPERESVDRIVSAENLRAVASVTSEPEVLLGLSFLARSGDPVREEIGRMAVKMKADYASTVAVLTVMMDRIDAESVSELVQRDPENALGHYLCGTLLHVSNNEAEALDAFRRAAACSEMRFYDSVTGQALFRALDAVGLKGLDRVCALSWTTSRWMGFSGVGIQPIYGAVAELARGADRATRSELSDILVTMAGHLFSTNFTNRWYAQRAVESAFSLKADVVAEESPARRNGYVAAVYGLFSPMSSPGVKEWWQHSPQQLAFFLPNRIHRSLLGADPALIDAAESDLNPNDRTALAAAKEKAAQAARKLVDAALSDPDGIFGPYLKGLPRVDQEAGERPLFRWTPVEGLIEKRPDLFQAAAANEEARATLWQAGASAVSRRNAVRMMDIAWAIQHYVGDHGGAFPDSLSALFEGGYLKPPLEARSLRTGRPYVYVAAGEQSPSKANERTQFVLFYDDQPISSGWYECAFASCLCNGLRASDLNEHLRKRGKQGP